VKAIGIGREIDGMIMAKGGKVPDAGNAPVRIVSVILLVRDEGAHSIWVVAEHRFPRAKREQVQRNETQDQIQEEEQKH
jgi:hypothetical protein